MMRIRKQYRSSKRPKAEKPDGLTIAWNSIKNAIRKMWSYGVCRVGELWDWFLQLVMDVRSSVSNIPVPLLVFLISILVYSYRPIVQGLDDNTPLRFGALQIATEGSPKWEVLSPDITASQGFARNAAGLITAHTPMGSAALGAVVFRAAISLGFDMSPENIVFFDCFAATFITALTVGMFAWVVRRYGRRTALLMALTFAFGTACWGVSSRQLWQHTGELFWLMAGLCVLDGASRRGARLLTASIFFALAFWCRPSAFPVIAVIMGYQWRRNTRIALIAASVLSVLLVGWMFNNYRTSGTVLGTYLYAALSDTIPKLTCSNIIDSMFGAYFSFNVGMCIFSPLVLFGMLCMVPWKFLGEIWRSERRNYLVISCVVFAVSVAVCKTLLANINALYLVFVILAVCGYYGWHSRNELLPRIKGWWQRRENPEMSVMKFAVLVGIISRGLVPNWAGWNVFGGRYMLDFIPCMLIVIAPVVHNLVEGDALAWSHRKLYVLRIVFIAVLASSVFVQWMGATRESFLWSLKMETYYDFWYSKKAWDWKRPLLMHVLTYGKHTAGWPDKPENYVLPKNGKVEFTSGDNRYIWYGMGRGEPFGWWTVPPQSGIALTLSKNASYKIQLTVAGPSYILDPTKVEFYWNGVKIGEHLFETGYLTKEQTRWMDLPREAMNVGRVSALEIRTSRSYYGWLASQGATGVAIVDLTVKEF